MSVKSDNDCVKHWLLSLLWRLLCIDPTLFLVHLVHIHHGFSTASHFCAGRSSPLCLSSSRLCLLLYHRPIGRPGVVFLLRCTTVFFFEKTQESLHFIALKRERVVTILLGGHYSFQVEEINEHPMFGGWWLWALEHPRLPKGRPRPCTTVTLVLPPIHINYRWFSKTLY